jgi:hypothetical protein
MADCGGLSARDLVIGVLIDGGWVGRVRVPIKKANATLARMAGDGCPFVCFPLPEKK